VGPVRDLLVTGEVGSNIEEKVGGLDLKPTERIL